MRAVAAQDWLREWSDLYSSGHTYFDFLTAVDRVDMIDVVGHAVSPVTAQHVLLVTSVPTTNARIDSLSALFRGADWHERETAEMFGIDFVGHIDPRPLLLRTTLGRPPMRKSTVLAARAAIDWPGAAEPASVGSTAARRRQRPPGVPEGWLEEEA